IAVSRKANRKPVSIAGLPAASSIAARDAAFAGVEEFGAVAGCQTGIPIGLPGAVLQTADGRRLRAFRRRGLLRVGRDERQQKHRERGDAGTEGSLHRARVRLPGARRQSGLLCSVEELHEARWARWLLPCEAGEGDHAKHGGGGVAGSLPLRLASLATSPA